MALLLNSAILLLLVTTQTFGFISKEIFVEGMVTSVTKDRVKFEVKGEMVSVPRSTLITHFDPIPGCPAVAFVDPGEIQFASHLKKDKSSLLRYPEREKDTSPNENSSIKAGPFEAMPK